jgi:hypothetical protein
MTDESAKPEEWYLGRNCFVCGGFIPMFPAGRAASRRPPLVHLECPHCHKEADYAVVGLKRRQLGDPG